MIHDMQILTFSGNRFIDGLHTIGRIVKQAPTELREITLQSTASLISVPVSLIYPVYYEQSL